MNKIDFKLPEFAFVDAHAHEGDLLKGRTVIHHIRSYSVIEVIALHDVVMCDFGRRPTHIFSYRNRQGIYEEFMLVLHFSFSEESNLPGIFKKCANWYRAYLRWEDRNIELDVRSRLN